MDKSSIKKNLALHHTAFISCIQGIPIEECRKPQGEKWSYAQQLEHILKSVRPVQLAFSLPKFLLLFFGQANRPTRSYESLVEKYRQRLKAGGRAPSRFLPTQMMLDVDTLGNSLERMIWKLSVSLDHFSEEQLDRLLLPHPLLGKLTLREMLYFTIYHVQHHHHQVNANHRS